MKITDAKSIYNATFPFFLLYIFPISALLYLFSIFAGLRKSFSTPIQLLKKVNVRVTCVYIYISVLYVKTIKRLFILFSLSRYANIRVDTKLLSYYYFSITSGIRDKQTYLRHFLASSQSGGKVASISFPSMENVIIIINRKQLSGFH